MSIIKRCTGLIAAIAVCAAASSAFAQPHQKEDKVLVVVSSLDKKTPELVGGFWFPELTHPVEVFDKAGLDYDIASPKGGLPPFDGFDLKDQGNLDFWTNPEHRNKLANSIPLAKVDPTKYTAILLVGGHGPMWDFVNNPELINIVRTTYENNGIVSAVCHGPAGLLNVKLSNGELLIKGRHLTGFTAEEEVSRNYDKIVPFELEAALKKDGAIFEEAPIFENKVVVDGRLITGQNPASAKALGEAVVKALQAKA
ncbi:type 1 glutamine amidotransferase domain-containing protein [Pectobacterium parmentieri]|uniref:ThiJ/PfpI n=1 Tax=Pectobacterium parmentieri TaxID=1905730 RepID=A0A0H3I089_PECPM|nr:type 1 glutamine amidotransferase domain-containing protein [Pectobacterium parmentieri]ACX86593.1 ThiJ/PfpI domain protein [Pectobacterium parmentieri WPP163]AFI88798.1 ThiJ/PfpI [Pectobacterium parmentieri]AYH04552.1 type 1 glutamine amidotransferase domain-containing protein [Pectobacterium parmentieri]AYH13374.1 type 1 glutamine amidotransferase domain-containing protein [Pectobacterium parmentieri]AYH22076.1 type 1 glutamine amidotransferase domain-containing protein [Pectobacterium pa